MSGLFYSFEYKDQIVYIPELAAYCSDDLMGFRLTSRYYQERAFSHNYSDCHIFANRVKKKCDQRHGNSLINLRLCQLPV